MFYLMSEQLKVEKTGRTEAVGINALPDDVIEYILVLLPIVDAVRTSVLSKAWRYKWRHIPDLVFDSISFPFSYETAKACELKVVRVVNEVLSLHGGKIRKFKFSYCISSYSEVDIGINFLSNAGIQELILEFDEQSSKYMVPTSLFNCSTLIKLSLELCVLKIPRCFKTFSTLTTISFTCVMFPHNSRLEALIRQCPVLRSLTLEYCDGCDELEIITPTLCYFRVVGFLPDLRFNTPMLDFLDLCLRSWPHEFVEQVYGCIDLLGGLPNLQKLQLSEFLLEFLSVSNALNSVKVFTKLKVLNIYKCDCLKEPKTLLWLLRSSPFLESLYINNKKNLSSQIPVPEFWNVDGDLDFNFNSLKKLKIKRLCVAAIRFIEFVLRNAPSLEEVYIDHGSDIPDGVFCQLLSFPSASSKARILC